MIYAKCILCGIAAAVAGWLGPWAVCRKCWNDGLNFTEAK